MNAKAFKKQYYENIKSSCLSAGKLFVDKEFPASIESIYKVNVKTLNIVWRRPHQIASNPKFIVDGLNPNDLHQGSTGNCWIISSIMSVATHPEYIEKVVPMDQSFERNYCGVFHFRFWKYGRWYDVVIDDQLPVDPYTNKLIFSNNKRTTNEFWPALLEKAYAKIATCYEFLNGGFMQDSLIDLTGGIDEVIDLRYLRHDPYAKTHLWNRFEKAFKMKSLITAAIFGKVQGRETMRSNGLAEGHAYSILKIFEFDQKGSKLNFYGFGGFFDSRTDNKVRLLRVKNPWNDHHEWNGKYSDNSREWKKLPKQLLEQIGLKKDNDGEFWISLEDFLDNFDNVAIVHVDINAYYLDDPDLNSKFFKWKCDSYEGQTSSAQQFISGGLVRGSQYLITLRNIDPNSRDRKSTLIVSLTQKGSFHKRARNHGQYNEEMICFNVYRLRSPANIKEGVVRINLNNLVQAGSSGSPANFQTVTKRFRLDPGDYIIVPEAYRTGLKYFIRIYTEAGVQTNSYSSGVSCSHEDEEETQVQPQEEENQNKLLENNTIDFSYYNSAFDRLKKMQENFFKYNFSPVIENREKEIIKDKVENLANHFNTMSQKEEKQNTGDTQVNYGHSYDNNNNYNQNMQYFNQNFYNYPNNFYHY